MSKPPKLLEMLVRVLHYGREVDGRLLVAGALAVYFLLVAIPRAFGVDIWPALGVPSGPSLFFDTRNVTAALECRRLGFDPLHENPCDPTGRPMNYPRAWLLLRWLGLDQSHTDALAVFLILLFLTSVFLLVGRISTGEGIVLALALCSPSVMFAIERANMDIVVFSLLVASVLVWRRRGRWFDAVSPLIVLLAATAKIYPAAGLLAFPLSGRRRAATVAFVCAVVFVVYAALTWQDIQTVARIAPQGQHHSFGARILPAALYHLFIAERWAGTLTKQIVAVLPILVLGPLLWTWGRRRRPPRPDDLGDASLLSFHLGSLLFLGTFATANNFDYRLVFLLLTLPKLFRWVTAEPRDRRAPLAAVTLTVIVVLLWISALSEQLALTDELVTWATAGLVVALLAASTYPVQALGKLAPRGWRERDPSFVPEGG